MKVASKGNKNNVEKCKTCVKQLIFIALMDLTENKNSLQPRHGVAKPLKQDDHAVTLAI